MADGGSPLEVFEDFVLSTGPANLTGPESVVNECTKHSYLLGRLMRGAQMSDMIQGGERIKDEIFLQEISLFINYQTNQKFTWDNPQVLSRWDIPWRFSMNHMQWTDQEILLNNAELSTAARFKKYKTLKRVKEMNLWTSFMNAMEEQLWAVPDPDEMEEDTGTTPNSIPVFVNEETDGLFFGYETASGGPNTVQGLDPSTYTKWVPQQETYDHRGAYSTGTHLFTGFDKLWRKLRFARLPKRPDLSDPQTSPAFFACSDDGLTCYEDALRVNQNVLRHSTGSDPAYPHPTYKGVDIVYVSELDGAELYRTGTSGALSNEWDTADTGTHAYSGPRYWGINGYYMLKAIHSMRYFFKKRPFSPSNQPWNHIMPVDIWHNTCVRSRQRHGILYPDANIATL